VVAGQHLMQASSDIFLGWLARGAQRAAGTPTIPEAAARLETVCGHRGDGPRGHAGVCPALRWTLARAHARAGDRIAIAAYLGNSDKFDNAIADFAET
jgi:hypothetical protein